jgi:Putative stress-responsive transcriptional regulator
MKTFMTIAAGAALGYFLYQYLTSSSRNTTNGRIHKSARNKRVSGVCAGIAEWLGIDPTIIRIAWAVLVFGWGSGVLLYFLFAFILPEE